MIKRTVSGAVVEGGAPPRQAGGTPPQPTKPSELKRWEGRDEWELPVVSRGEPEDEFPWELSVVAVDATAAAEMFVEALVEQHRVEGPTTVSVRRKWPPGPWIKIAVHVELTVEAEISATRVVSEPRPAKRQRRRAKA